MHEFVNIDFTTPVISNNNNNAIIAKRQTQRNYKRLMTFMHVWRLTWILTNLLANFCHVYWKMLQNILGWNRRHSCVIHTMTVWPSVAWLVIRRFTNRFRVISAKMGHQVNWDRNLKPKLAIMRQCTSVRQTDGHWYRSIKAGTHYPYIRAVEQC